jgi:hypothetical protein
MGAEENERIVAALWECLYRKDFEGVAACIAEHGLHQGVPAPDPGARMAQAPGGWIERIARHSAAEWS